MVPGSAGSPSAYASSSKWDREGCSPGRRDAKRSAGSAPLRVCTGHPCRGAGTPPKPVPTRVPRTSGRGPRHPRGSRPSLRSPGEQTGSDLDVVPRVLVVVEVVDRLLLPPPATVLNEGV